VGRRVDMAELSNIWRIKPKMLTAAKKVWHNLRLRLKRRGKSAPS
jgi:hypothetical protein